MDTLLYRSTRTVLMATALIQLAVSQVHIEMITKLFIRDIGFYLFIFVIAGLLVLFNLTSMKETSSGRLGAFVLMTLGAVASGGVYVYKIWSDYTTQESVTLEIVQKPLIIAIICIAIYLIGGIIVTSKCLAKTDK